MVQLSVNINKVATLRNSRGGALPSVAQAARVCIDAGAHGITVHPRGAIKTARAAEIFQDEGAVEVVAHDLESQTFEFAASRGEGYWVRHFMLDNPTGADCIYCRLFPAHKHEH